MAGLHDWMLETWYGATRRGAWLLPLSWLFAAVSWLRRRLYGAGLLQRYRSSRPVVVVGNVTVGADLFLLPNELFQVGDRVWRAVEDPLQSHAVL